MKRQNSILLFFLLALTTQLCAQDYNPFKSIGKEGKIKKAYGDNVVEVFDYDTIQRIGSVLFNIKTKRIVELLPDDQVFKKYSNNSSASRWYQIDPLADKGKNISYSPYVYTINNPVNYVDPDGRDGVRVIDQKNKTITITAVYFVQSQPRAYTDDNGKQNFLGGYSSKEISKMQSSVNEYLNGLKLGVTEGDYKDFSIKFDLSFREGGDVMDSRNSATNEMMDGNSIGNSLTKGNEFVFASFKTREIEGDNGETKTVATGGNAEKSKHITMNKDYDTKMNRVHEIFHTFGFTHPKGAGAKEGVMSYPPQKPNQKDINNVANGSFLPIIIR